MRVNAFDHSYKKNCNVISMNGFCECFEGRAEHDKNGSKNELTAGKA